MTGIEVGAVVALGAAGLAGVAAARAWIRLRGSRVITCPENRQPAGVELDLPYAALTAAVGRSHFRLRDCSRWPEKAGCGQVCLMEVEESPEDCLVRHVLERWYVGKACAYCGHVFAAVHWHDHKPGLRAPEGTLREWSEVAPVEVPVVLATHRPVCWNCVVAEGFRRRFPDLVMDRAPRPTQRPH